MEVKFSPETEKKLRDFCAQNGRDMDDFVEGAVAVYFDELAHTREMLDRRYDEMAGGKVQGIDGEEFFEELHRREDELLKNRAPQ